VIIRRGATGPTRSFPSNLLPNRTSLYLRPPMECWLITSRAEVMRLEFGEEPPPEICLPDKPLSEVEDNATRKALQDAPYIMYMHYHLAHESWRPAVVGARGLLRRGSAHVAEPLAAPGADRQASVPIQAIQPLVIDRVTSLAHLEKQEPIAAAPMARGLTVELVEKARCLQPDALPLRRRTRTVHGATSMAFAESSRLQGPHRLFAR